MKHLIIIVTLVTFGFFAKASTVNPSTVQSNLSNKLSNAGNVVVLDELKNLLHAKFDTETLFKLNTKTADEIRNLTKEEFVAFVSSCFDFYDSCGGSWTVCHEGVSAGELIAFLWEWDGGC